MTKTTWRRMALTIVFASVLFVGESAAIDFERLLMPGPVAGLHAEIENDCSKCHSPFATGREAALCMFCHEDVAADRSTGEGFHGRDRGATELTCRTCHTEHKGRDHDISGLDPNGFNHDATDYPLLGSHRATACEDCHPTDGKTRRRDAPSGCRSCHGEEDRHDGRLGEQCGDCHGETRWSAAKFDHSKTEYPLTGKHTEVACGRCHPNEQYRGVPTACIDCHRIDDDHQGGFGKDCAACHTPESFKGSGSYDHDKETKFPLKGRHNEVKCASCHVESAEEVRLSMSCDDCHQIVDVHRGLLGSKCEDCHSSEKWESATFDHSEATRFELRGRHLRVDCVGCHRTTPGRENTIANCRSCHSGDDVHHGQLDGACAGCHNEKSWTEEIFFEHDLARFPLLGLHAAVTCEDCHASSQFHDAKMACVDCHSKDDTHQRTLGAQCARCHNPNGWNIWVFDHSTQTEFPLSGGHEGLACRACHSQPSELHVRMSKDCYACHSREDSHRGRFGRNCEACHDDESWKNTRMIR